MKSKSVLRGHLRITKIIQVEEHTEQPTTEKIELMVQKTQQFKPDNILKEKHKTASGIFKKDSSRDLGI